MPRAVPRVASRPAKPKQAQKPAHEFVLEALMPLMPELRRMFSGFGVCVGDRIVFMLRDHEKSPRDNGVWLVLSESTDCGDPGLRREFLPPKDRAVAQQDRTLAPHPERQLELRDGGASRVRPAAATRSSPWTSAQIEAVALGRTKRAAARGWRLDPPQIGFSRPTLRANNALRMRHLWLCWLTKNREEAVAARPRLTSDERSRDLSGLFSRVRHFNRQRLHENFHGNEVFNRGDQIPEVMEVLADPATLIVSLVVSQPCRSL